MPTSVADNGPQSTRPRSAAPLHPPPNVLRGHRDHTRYAPICLEAALRTILLTAVKGIVHSLLRRRRTQRHIARGSWTPPPSLTHRLLDDNIKSVSARTRNANRRAGIMAEAVSHARRV